MKKEFPTGQSSSITSPYRSTIRLFSCLKDVYGVVLKKTSSKWEKVTSFLEILSWVYNGEGKESSHEVLILNIAYSWPMCKWASFPLYKEKG
jgi:hypothetical protein